MDVSAMRELRKSKCRLQEESWSVDVHNDDDDDHHHHNNNNNNNDSDNDNHKT